LAGDRHYINISEKEWYFSNNTFKSLDLAKLYPLWPVTMESSWVCRIFVYKSYCWTWKTL